MFLNYLYQYSFVGADASVVIAAALLFVTVVGWLISYIYRAEYLSSVKRAIRETDRFVETHLLITDANAKLFFRNCIAFLPVELQRSWRDYMRRKEGRPSEYFPSSAYTKNLVAKVYNGQCAAFGFFAMSAFVAMLVGLAFLGVGAVDILIAGVILAYVSLSILCAYACRRAREYVSIPRRVEELLQMLDRFANMRSTTLVSVKGVKPTQTQPQSRPVEIAPEKQADNTAAC